MTYYSMREAAAKSGATMRQIDHWCHNGLFGPDHARPGSGNHRTFTLDEVEEMRVLVHVQRKLATFDMKASAKLMMAVLARYRKNPQRFRERGVTITLGLPPGVKPKRGGS